MQFLKHLLGASHGVHASYTTLRLRPYHCENGTEGMGKQEEMERKKNLINVWRFYVASDIITRQLPNQGKGSLGLLVSKVYHRSTEQKHSSV